MRKLHKLTVSLADEATATDTLLREFPGNGAVEFIVNNDTNAISFKGHVVASLALQHRRVFICEHPLCRQGELFRFLSEGRPEGRIPQQFSKGASALVAVLLEESKARPIGMISLLAHLLPNESSPEMKIARIGQDTLNFLNMALAHEREKAAR